MSSSKSSSMRPVRHTEVDPLWRTVTVSPALNVSPDPSVNWSAVPIVREPIASSGESWVLTKTVTRSRSLGFRPSATWVITMESPSSAANFFACDDERSGTGRRRSAGGSVRERRCGARPGHRRDRRRRKHARTRPRKRSSRRNIARETRSAAASRLPGTKGTFAGGGRRSRAVIASRRRAGACTRDRGTHLALGNLQTEELGHRCCF